MRPQVKSTVILSLLGLSLALNAAFAVGYFKGSEKRKEISAARPGESDYCLLDHLKLDADQQRLLEKMRHEMQKKRDLYWQRARAIKGELAEEICTVPANREALTLQLERYTENQAAMQLAVAEHLIGVNAMLHPDQRDEFRTLLRTEMFEGIHPSQNESVGEP